MKRFLAYLLMFCFFNLLGMVTPLISSNNVKWESAKVLSEPENQRLPYYNSNLDENCILNFTTSKMKLIDFKVIWEKEEQIVKLNWITMDEKDLDYYIIEMRPEHVERFEEVIKINAKGEQFKNFYRLKDPNVKEGNRYFYRLRSIDNKGNINKEFIEEVIIPSDRFTIKSFQNAEMNKLFVVVNGKKTEKVHIELLNKLEKKPIQFVDLPKNNKTYEKISIDVSELRQDQYFIKIISGQSVEIKTVFHIE